MRLPKDLIDPSVYTKPNIYLCEPDKKRICKLETYNTNCSFKFGSYSDITFEVSRTYNNSITGTQIVNPYFDKIEGLRLVEIENIGYFEIQSPDLSSDGIKESKSVTAYSLEYTLSQKYLENFYINTGAIDSVEVMYAEDCGTPNDIIPVTLYNRSIPELSLLHLILDNIYGWKIGYIDDSLLNISRVFEVDRMSVYDFIINEICEKCNCYVVFDTIDNSINFYSESLTYEKIGDGVSNTFVISPPFKSIGTVSIDGYKTTRWSYNQDTGELTLIDTPADGSRINIIDGSDKLWETDVFITFENLSQEVKVSYSIEDIKTMLSVTYGEDGDIREVNMGSPYLIDLSYYHTVDWMGQDLYDAYTNYLKRMYELQQTYSDNAQKSLDLASLIEYEENRLSLQYSVASSVHSTTVGTYYVRGGDAPNYYYTEVSLPKDYDANETYYSMDTANLNEDKVSNLFEMLKWYYSNNTDWESKFDEMTTDFVFMESPSFQDFKTALETSQTISEKDNAVISFLTVMWNEIGLTPLKSIYYDTYKTVQLTNIDAGWSVESDANYWLYYPVTLFLSTIDMAIKQRELKISQYKLQQTEFYNNNLNISLDLGLNNNFTPEQMRILSAFLREDELQLDDIIDSDLDTVQESFRTKQDAMESGKIELRKISQPRLQFSMTMANIYALPEFESIVGKFQLGNIIKVGLRDDYIKQSRLLSVNINLDDFSDFSCEFGDLTNLRTVTDVHADLLKQAVTAGKQVASNNGYWTKGTEIAVQTYDKVNQGLLDAGTSIKSIDGTQSVEIDKYGIHLRKENPDNVNGYDDKQGWIVNNQFLYSDDAFKTVKSVFGEYSIGDEKYWGLLAEAVIAGYIEGTKIQGSEIQGSRIQGGALRIGQLADDKWSLEVNENGIVSLLGGYVEFDPNNGTNTLKDKLENIEGNVNDFSNKTKYDIKVVADGPTTITSTTDTATLKCEVYLWGAIDNSLPDRLFNWKRKSVNSVSFIGNGASTSFGPIPSGCSQPTIYINGVVVDDCMFEDGNIIFNTAPSNNSIIEVIDIMDVAWNNDQRHKGVKAITITYNDIREKSSFYCEVEDLPEQ